LARILQKQEEEENAKSIFLNEKLIEEENFLLNYGPKNSIQKAVDLEHELLKVNATFV
jgi:hypothetical protein